MDRLTYWTVHVRVCKFYTLLVCGSWPVKPMPVSLSAALIKRLGFSNRVCHVM